MNPRPSDYEPESGVSAHMGKLTKGQLRGHSQRPFSMRASLTVPSHPLARWSPSIHSPVGRSTAWLAGFGSRKRAHSGWRRRVIVGPASSANRRDAPVLLPIGRLVGRKAHLETLSPKGCISLRSSRGQRGLYRLGPATTRRARTRIDSSTVRPHAQPLRLCLAP